MGHTCHTSYQVKRPMVLYLQATLALSSDLRIINYLAKKIETGIEKICKWFEQNNMKMSNEKTNIIVCRSAGKPSMETIQIDNSRVALAESSRFLGITNFLENHWESHPKPRKRT